MSQLRCHSPLSICHFKMPLLTCHSKNVTLNMSPSTCHSQPANLHSLYVTSKCHSWLVTLRMSLLTYHSLHVTLNMLLSTYHSLRVTLDMSLLTCHSSYVYVIHMVIFRDFEISNFFVSESPTDSLTFTRPREAFAPKKTTKLELSLAKLSPRST